MADIKNITIDGTTYDLKDAKAREDVSDLKEDINDNIQNKIKWAIGTLDASLWHIVPSTTRLVTCDFIPICDCSVGPDGKFGIHIYGEYFNHLGIYRNGYVQNAKAKDIITAFPNAKYMRIVFAHWADSETVALTDIVTYNVVISQNKMFNAITDSMMASNIIAFEKMQNGGLYANGLPDPSSTLRVVTAGYYEVTPCEEYAIVLHPNTTEKTVMTSVSFYDYNDYMTDRTGNTPWVHGDCNIITIPEDTQYIRIIAGYTDNSAITASDIAYWKLIKIEEIKMASSGYAIGADLLRKELYANLIGTLSQDQAFCKYNNKYYSTNGNTITVQDSELNVIESASVSIGHGNTLQLGSNGFAYAFGWDDNTIYKINLESLVVSDAIVLPTTGYTSGVVDDQKGIVYIFQRDSAPTTEAQYNFIVYDYVNSNIIRTSKTPPFAALQSCDFISDRIIAINGGGDNTMPNGYRVYDTFGNVISEYKLTAFSNIEPEGICIDRETGELLISFVDKKCYRITI